MLAIEKDEIDFRNQLLPDKDDIEQENVRKENDKPWLTSQLVEDIQMFLAVFLILVLTVLVITIKIYYFSGGAEDGVTTFKPLTQNKNSNQKYNGPGFIPCNGLLPCQLDHFPAEYNQQRKEGQMAEWNGVEG